MNSPCTEPALKVHSIRLPTLNHFMAVHEKLGDCAAQFLWCMLRAAERVSGRIGKLTALPQETHQLHPAGDCLPPTRELALLQQTMIGDLVPSMLSAVHYTPPF